MVEESNEKSQTTEADLSQMVQKTLVEKEKQVDVKIIETKMLQEVPYTDPIPEEYVVRKENLLGAIKNRESKEGIKTIHDMVHSMGGHPEWG